jgi:hypothetical protein
MFVCAVPSEVALELLSHIDRIRFATAATVVAAIAPALVHSDSLLKAVHLRLLCCCLCLLAALSQEPGPAGLSVTQLWLSRLLLQLSSRVAAYTSITTLAPTQAVALAGVGSSSSSSSGSSSSILRRALPSALADSQSSAVGAAATGATAGIAAAQNEATAAAAAAAAGQGLPSFQADAATANLTTADAEKANPARTADVDLGASSTESSSKDYEPPAGFSSSSSISSGSSWWGLGGRWWWWGNSSTPSSGIAPLGPTQTPNAVSDSVTNDVWSQLEAAKAAHWRDAAPVTPAYAKAAAEELKAASLAMLSSWQAAAQQLALPSDLVPGMFAPAVVEAYPAAARAVDYSVAQQRTTHVMEVSARCYVCKGCGCFGWPITVLLSLMLLGGVDSRGCCSAGWSRK